MFQYLKVLFIFTLALQGSFAYELSRSGYYRDASNSVRQSRIDDDVEEISDTEIAPTPGQSLVEKIMELFGVNSGKLRSMALSLIVYMAEYITKTLFMEENDILTNEIPEYRSLVENEGYISAAMKLINNSERHAQEWVDFFEDDDLPNAMIDLLQRQTGSATSCAQMFICKTAPIITGVQTSLKKKNSQAPRSYESDNWWGSFYSSLPSARAFVDNNYGCESRHPSCSITNF